MSSPLIQLALLALFAATTCDAFSVSGRAALPITRAASSASPPLASIRMQEQEEEETPTPTPADDAASAQETYTTPDGAASSPLAALAGKQNLEEFKKKKEADNKKRNEARAKINIALPAVTGAFFLLATFVGEDKVKETAASFANPMDNAPGMAETKQRKAEAKAQAKAEQEAFMKSFRKNVLKNDALKVDD